MLPGRAGRKIARGVILFVIVTVILAPTAMAAESFAPITDAERTLTEVPGEPNAPAVVLFKIGDVKLKDEERAIHSSRMEVNLRIKILNEAGLEFAEWTVSHSEDLRLRELKARTVLPDGTEIVVGDDDVFERKDDVADKHYQETVIVFPGAEVGAILDLTYVLRFNGYLLDGWLFQSPIPTLHSEIEYLIPKSLGIAPWGKQTFNRTMQNETKRTPKGRVLRVWMDDLPGFPDEPFTVSDFDMSSVFDLTIAKYYGQSLFETWDFTHDRYDDWYYRSFRKKGKKSAAKALELVSGATTTKEKAERIYRFVRDEIATRRAVGIHLADKSTADGVLEDAEGDYAEKSLLLKTMLTAVGIESQAIWVADGSRWTVDLSFVQPNWFDRIFIRLQLQDTEVFLDPSSRRNGFGWFRSSSEGAPSIALVKKKKAEKIVLPTKPAEGNTREIGLELEIDEEGALHGSGSLVLSGHPARDRFDWKGEEGKTREAWANWLKDRYPRFEIEVESVNEDVELARLVLAWTMKQFDDDVLGDEVSLVLAAAFGIESHPYQLATGHRRTPVQRRYEQVWRSSVRVHWPETFDLDVVPVDAVVNSDIGGYELRYIRDRTINSLRMERTLRLDRRRFMNGAEYLNLRKIYNTAQKSDVKPAVWIAN